MNTYGTGVCISVDKYFLKYYFQIFFMFIYFYLYVVIEYQLKKLFTLFSVS